MPAGRGMGMMPPSRFLITKSYSFSNAVFYKISGSPVVSTTPDALPSTWNGWTTSRFPTPRFSSWNAFPTTTSWIWRASSWVCFLLSLLLLYIFIEHKIPTSSMIALNWWIKRLNLMHTLLLTRTPVLIISRSF